MNSQIRSFLLLLLIFSNSALIGQGFVKRYEIPLPRREGANALLQTPDGGFLIAGTAINPGTGYDGMLIRTDAQGDTLWVKYPCSPFWAVVITDICLAPDSNYVIAGYTQGGGQGQNYYWAKVDPNGNLLWENFGGSTGTDYAYKVRPTYDNGYIIVGRGGDIPVGSGVMVIKIDSAGTRLWTQGIAPGSNAFPFWGEETADHGILVTGTYTGRSFALKLDEFGNQRWVWQGPANSIGYVGRELSNGDYLIATGYPFDLSRIDTAGNLVSTSRISTIFFPKNLVETHDGNYAIAGMFNNGPGYDEYGLILVDTSYNTLQSHKYRKRTNTLIQGFRNIGLVETADHGFAMAHVWAGLNYPNSQEMDAILIRTDSAGFAYTNMISGSVYADLNGNCVEEPVDFPQAGVLVELDNGVDWKMTDQNGDYAFETGPGNHTVRIHNNHPYLSTGCPAGDSLLVSFPAPHDTLDSADFALNIQENCPLLTVDLAAGIFRPGMVTPITVNYCNVGFATANPVLVQVDLGVYLSMVQSTVPATPLGNNSYSFNLDSLAAGACGSFVISALVDTTALLGATTCTEAHIFPDTLCEPADTTWDRSSVQVNGQCVNDSLACFTVLNTGSPNNGNMQGTTDWRMFVNGTLTQWGSLQLSGGQDTILCFPASGNSIRMEVDQRPGHPGNSRPNDHVENCGNNQQPPVLGQVNTFPQNNADPFVDVLCRQIVNSYDPNIKEVYPNGLGAHHFVPHGQNLHYVVHFQNTGTAPAINVVVKDTLSPLLNLGTLKLLGSSHPLTDFKILPNRVLQWRFLNINLPDSTNNEPESHGWLSFKIDPVGGQPSWTQIDNRVGIFFDFNEPVITDWAFVTLHDTTIVYLEEGRETGALRKLLVYPNPSQTLANFTFAEAQEAAGHYELQLFDLQGRMLHAQDWDGISTLQLDVSQLPEGLYLYRFLQNGVRIGSGKLVKRN